MGRIFPERWCDTCDAKGLPHDEGCPSHWLFKHLTTAKNHWNAAMYYDGSNQEIPPNLKQWVESQAIDD